MQTQREPSYPKASEFTAARGKQLHTEPQKSPVVILGGGSTGLGTALGVTLHGTDKRVWVVEKKSVPGGLAGSFRWKEHIVDYGPHRLSPNLKVIRVLAEELLGPDCLVNKSQHGVQVNGRLYQFPPRIIDWLSPRAIFDALAFGLSFLAAPLKWVVSRFSRDNFESTMAHRFGSRFYERIVKPMAEKVWVDPAEIDPSFVNQRFAQIHPLEVIKKVIFPKQELNPSLFYYPRKGFQQLWDNLAEYLERNEHRVLYESIPTELRVHKNRIEEVVIEQQGQRFSISDPDLQVVSTIPVVKLLETLRGFDAEPLLEKARRLRFKSMILVAFEFDTPRALPFRTLIFPEKEFTFNRLFEQNEYSRETVAPNRSVVVADITLPRGDERMKVSDADIVAQVRRELEKLSYIPLDKIIDVRVERVEFAYAVPDIHSRRYFYEIHHILKKIQNLHLVGRFAIGEYDNSDYAIDSGVTLGATLSGRASRLDYLVAQHSKRGRSIVG